MSTLQTLSIWVLPLLFAITLHEVAHGLTARYLGDTTAEELGRLSLNPIRHIDPIGTVLVPLLLFFVGGFVFGWAKPVPVNMARLNNPKRDMAVVAVAGPLANLFMALLWASVSKLGTVLYGDFDWIAIPMLYMGQAGIAINLILMILNLLPVPPLDGGRVLAGLLPDRMAYALAKIEPYGFFIVLGLLALGILGQILSPPYAVLSGIINKVFALPF
ncbi:MAG: site-2 protease family protein [Gammaproteobacteria bacterium]|nr:site-2 protease family protein [Gammaproteobacteria bacterium]